MTTKPHLCFAPFSGAFFASFYQMADPGFTSKPVGLALAVLASFIGSIFPDIDTPSSPISRALPFLARPIQRLTSHRGFFHSLLGATIVSFGIFLIAGGLANLLPIPKGVPGVVGFFFLAGMLGHCVVDTLTTRGVAWFFPWPKPIVYHIAPQYRVRTGDKKTERNYSILFLCLFCCWLRIVLAGGATRSIHKSFKSFEMARADYVDVGGQETVLEFTGTFRHSRVPVHGTGLILDVRPGAFVVFCDGRILTVGDQAQVLATSFVVEYTQDAPEVAEWPITRESLESILARLPANVLISGELIGHQQFAADMPVYAANEFQTVAMTGNSIRLTYADKTNIAGLGIRLPEATREKQREIQVLQEEVAAVGHELAATTDSLNATRDLLARHQLRERMVELKNKEKSLAEKLEKYARTADLAHTNGIAFSGKLLMRKLPGWTRNQ